MSPILVLGLGNPLLEDDGTGLELLARVRACAPWPGAIDFADGGTWGLSLLPSLEEADRLLVLDAVRTGAAPGTVRCARDDAVPRLYQRPVSPHQLDLGEVLAAATLLDTLPPRLAVVGIEPARTDRLHVGLTPAVAASLDRAAEQACRILEEWCAEVADPAHSPAPRGPDHAVGHASVNGAEDVVIHRCVADCMIRAARGRPDEPRETGVGAGSRGRSAAPPVPIPPR